MSVGWKILSFEGKRKYLADVSYFWNSVTILFYVLYFSFRITSCCRPRWIKLWGIFSLCKIINTIVIIGVKVRIPPDVSPYRLGGYSNWSALRVGALLGSLACFMWWRRGARANEKKERLGRASSFASLPSLPFFACSIFFPRFNN